MSESRLRPRPGGEAAPLAPPDAPGAWALVRPDGLEQGWIEVEPGLRLRHARIAARGAARGSVLVLPGRSEHIEKYHETLGDLAARGLDAFILDWRGQGLSGGRLTSFPLRGWVGSYGTYLADLALHLERVVLPLHRPPLLLLGHSMGAHLGLRLLHDRPGVVARAVLTAPLVDIPTGRVPRPLLRLLVRAATRLGRGHAYLPGHGDRGGLYRRFEDNRLTSCPVRFQAMQALLDDRPETALGGVTYQWLQATLESVALVARPGFAEAIETPVLVVSAGLDRVVSNVAQARLARRLPQGRIEVLPGARHDILMETDATRAAFFALFDAFLAEAG